MSEQETNPTAEQGGAAEQQEPQGGAQSENDRIFTQSDVNSIVQQRLATEKAKSAVLLQQKEQALREREQHYQARDTLNARGLPVELLEVMDYTNEKGFADALDKLDEIMTQRLQQSVEARLKGNIPKEGGGHAGPDVRSAFGLTRKG